MKRLELRGKIAALFRSAKTSIQIEDVPRLLSITPEEARRLMSRLEQQGWMTRLKRGVYLPLPLGVSSAEQWSEDPWILATVLYGPCYVGGWSACEHWGLTEQIFHKTMICTTRLIRERNQNILGVQFKIKTIKPARFFGTFVVWKEQTKTLVSDPSRTIVDLLDDPLIGGGFLQAIDVFKSYMASDHKKISILVDYAKKIGNKAVYKRLGYLCEILFPNEKELIQIRDA